MEPERLDELSRALAGLDLRLDAASRDAYSRDRSPFRRLPAAVLVAREAGDVSAGVEAAARLEIPVTPRAGGSSVAGQCLGSGLVLDVGALRGVEPGEPDGGWASVWVGAGEGLDDLNSALAGVGRAIGPDVNSSRWARVGGLLATNACGSRSLRYGRFAGVLLEAEVVLANGVRTSLHAGEVPESLAAGLAEARDGIEPDLVEWPRQDRDPGGYRLPELYERGDALSLMPGSEGTLGVITRARLATVEAARRRSLTIASFASLATALQAAPALALAGASSVEVLDARMVAAARRRGLGASGDAEAVLLVEALEEEGGASDDLALSREMGSATDTTRLTGEEAERAWRLRSGALELIEVDGGPVALSCFEDPAVPPELAAGFCAELLELLARFGFQAVVYGHAGAGCLHVRPLCDPDDPRLGERLLDAATAVCDLVGEWGGALTGEHGWGLARSHLLERSLGPSVERRFKAIKQAFDPAGVLNPGMIVGGHDPRSLVDVGR